MKQIINHAKKFNDTSQDFEIDSVYHVNGNLIAIWTLINTGNFGEAIIERSHSVIVDTPENHELPIKNIIISESQKSSIHEIQGHVPLNHEKYSALIFSIQSRPSQVDQVPTSSLKYNKKKFN